MTKVTEDSVLIAFVYLLQAQLPEIRELSGQLRRAYEEMSDADFKAAEAAAAAETREAALAVRLGFRTSLYLSVLDWFDRVSQTTHTGCRFAGSACGCHTYCCKCCTSASSAYASQPVWQQSTA